MSVSQYNHGSAAFVLWRKETPNKHTFAVGGEQLVDPLDALTPQLQVPRKGQRRKRKRKLRQYMYREEYGTHYAYTNHSVWRG